MASCQVITPVPGREAPVEWQETDDARGLPLPLSSVVMADSFIVLAMEHRFVVIFSAHAGGPGAAHSAAQRPAAHRNGSNPPRPPGHNILQVSPDHPDRDHFSLPLGISQVPKGGTQGFVAYEAVLEPEDITSHAVTAGLRME